VHPSGDGFGAGKVFLFFSNSKGETHEDKTQNPGRIGPRRRGDGGRVYEHR